jgi:hypothetical protein
VAPGGSLTLAAAATADGPLRYQWQHRGEDVPGATNATLALTGVTAAQAGDYWVAAYSRNGWRRSALATVTVGGGGGGTPAQLTYAFNPATGRLTIFVNGTDGASYRVEGSDDFATWTAVQTITADGSVEVPVTGPGAYRVYRAVALGGGPAGPATLAIAAGAGGTLEVTVTGTAGARYIVEKAPSPAGPYTALPGSVVSGGTVAVPNAAVAPGGEFLRARSE